MTTTAITAAKGALKLVPLYIQHPATIGQDTMLGAAAEACERLDRVPAAALDLLDAFEAVRRVLPQGYTAFVTPTSSAIKPYGAVVLDGAGQLAATAAAKSIEGLAQLIRLRIPQGGAGELCA